MNISVKVLLFISILLSVIGCEEKENNESSSQVKENVEAGECNQNGEKFISIHATANIPESGTFKSCLEFFGTDELIAQVLNALRNSDHITIDSSNLNTRCPRATDDKFSYGYKNINLEDILLSDSQSNRILFKELSRDLPAIIRQYFKKNGDPEWGDGNRSSANYSANQFVFDHQFSIVVESKNEDGSLDLLTCVDLSYSGKSLAEKIDILNRYRDVVLQNNPENKVTRINSLCPRMINISPELNGDQNINPDDFQYTSYLTCEELEQGTMLYRFRYTRDDSIIKDQDGNIDYDGTPERVNCELDRDASDGTLKALYIMERAEDFNGNLYNLYINWDR